MLTEADSLDYIPRRRHLSEEAARLIKDRIFRLTYTPGTRLIVEEIARDIKVSMTPVREGLKELVSQGLVVYDGKSYSVFKPNRKEITDLFLVRRYLEQLSAHEAAGCMEEEQMEQASAEHQQFLENEYLEDAPKLIALDMSFHRRIAENTRNPRLISILKPIQEQCWLIRLWGFSGSFPAQYTEATIQEHLQILDAVRSRDAAGAEQFMKEHIMRGEQRNMGALLGSSDIQSM